MNYMYIYKKKSRNKTHAEQSIFSDNKHPYSTIHFYELNYTNRKLIRNKQAVKRRKVETDHSRGK